VSEKKAYFNFMFLCSSVYVYVLICFVCKYFLNQFVLFFTSYIVLFCIVFFCFISLFESTPFNQTFFRLLFLSCLALSFLSSPLLFSPHILSPLSFARHTNLFFPPLTLSPHHLTTQSPSLYLSACMTLAVKWATDAMGPELLKEVAEFFRKAKVNDVTLSVT
jgi:hypothetical protein